MDNLFLYGPSYTGKTISACKHLLGHAARDYIEQTHRTFLFVKVSELLDYFRKAMNPDTATKLSRELLQNIDCLVLDDLGTEKVTDWVYEQLFLILDYRYEHLKQTIITSNYDLEELANKYSDTRITSRIEHAYTLLKMK